MTKRPLKVVHMMRPTSRKLFSIERVFAIVRSAMPADLGVNVSEWAPERAEGIIGMLRAAWAARAHQGDINHVTGDAHYLAWFLDRSRTVLTVHDLRYLERLTGPRRWLYWLLWFRIPLARCARVTAISLSTKNALLALAPWLEDRLDVVVNPLPGGFGAQDNSKARPLGSPLQVLHIGTAPPKNLPRHMDAIAGLDAQLTIVGPISDAVRAEIERHPAKTRICGPVSDEVLKGLYKSSDLLLFASLNEGFGLPILEAQAACLPVIAGNNSAMPETAGEGALLVDASDTDAIRGAITRLCEDDELRAQIIAKGKANLARFAAGAVATDYAAVYRAVAEMRA